MHLSYMQRLIQAKSDAIEYNFIIMYVAHYYSNVYIILLVYTCMYVYI